MNVSVSRRRLTKIVETLEDLPKTNRLPDGKRFSLQVWSCDSTACAFGYACSIPSFRRAGLGLVPMFTGTTLMQPSYKGHTHINAVKRFLGLTAEEIDYLFMDNYYPVGRRGSRSVAKRIRGFLKNGKISNKTY